MWIVMDASYYMSLHLSGIHFVHSILYSFGFQRRQAMSCHDWHDTTRLRHNQSFILMAYVLSRQIKSWQSCHENVTSQHIPYRPIMTFQVMLVMSKQCYVVRVWPWQHALSSLRQGLSLPIDLLMTFMSVKCVYKNISFIIFCEMRYLFFVFYRQVREPVNPVFHVNPVSIAGCYTKMLWNAIIAIYNHPQI